MLTLTLDVPDDVAEKLLRDAATMGLSVNEYALRRLGVEPEPPHQTGAELVDYLIKNNLIGPDIDDDTEDSSVVARRLREQAQRRDWSV